MNNCSRYLASSGGGWVRTMTSLLVIIVCFFSQQEVTAFQLKPSQHIKHTAIAFKHGATLQMINKATQTEIERQISSVTGAKFTIDSVRGGSGGGGGASVGTIIDTSKPIREYFYKSAMGASACEMLFAEFRGVSEMYDTKTIRVPQPICKGVADDYAFIIFEKLSIGGYGDGERMGRELACMHKHTSKNGMFGWDINNTIGATPQPNKWTEDWATFWDEQRLGYMLKKCRSMDEYPREKELRAKVKEILSKHQCVPSLVHGDLWSGNQAHTSEGDPVIFDPATYYGDREVDIAMTHLFGALSNKFYAAYDAEWPLPEGYQQRQVIYNLYHILNHYVLFGGGYWQQAYSMMDRILTF